MQTVVSQHYRIGVFVGVYVEVNVAIGLSQRCDEEIGVAGGAHRILIGKSIELFLRKICFGDFVVRGENVGHKDVVHLKLLQHFVHKVYVVAVAMSKLYVIELPVCLVTLDIIQSFGSLGRRIVLIGAVD